MPCQAPAKRQLGRSDIKWQPGSERDRTAILKVANRILREDQRCEAIDGESLLVEGEAGARQYTLNCDGPAGAHPTEFTAKDARSGRRFHMAAIDLTAPMDVSFPVEKAEAISACQDAIGRKLHQPRSADYRIFSETTFTTEGARSRLTIGFSAKNGFGNMMDATAECVFEGQNLTSAAIIP